MFLDLSTLLLIQMSYKKKNLILIVCMINMWHLNATNYVFLKKSQHHISGISSITKETTLKASVIGLRLLIFFLLPKLCRKKGLLSCIRSYFLYYCYSVRWVPRQAGHARNLSWLFDWELLGLHIEHCGSLTLIKLLLYIISSCNM